MPTVMAKAIALARGWWAGRGALWSVLTTWITPAGIGNKSLVFGGWRAWPERSPKTGLPKKIIQHKSRGNELTSVKCRCVVMAGVPEETAVQGQVEGVG